jgi:hypothetical protein
MAPSSGAWGVVSLFDDNEEPSTPPAVSPGAILLEQPTPIYRGAQAVGWRDGTGDHWYPGCGPEWDE